MGISKKQRHFYNFIWLMMLPTSQTLLLTKRYLSQNKPKQTQNIFQKEEEASHTGFKHEWLLLPNIYHFVGPHAVRQRVLQNNDGKSSVEEEKGLKKRQTEYKLQSEDKMQIKEQLLASGMSGSMISNGQRSSTRLSLGETKQLTEEYRNKQLSEEYRNKQLTKEYRNIQHFKQYQNRWDKQNTFIKRQSTNRNHPTLLERSKKSILVIANPEKDQILKNYITSYWEMSLRNNNKILKRHIQGNNRYDQSQLEELLQRDNGIKQVERSVPKLPIQQLTHLRHTDLIVTGRNKLQAESFSYDPSIMTQWSTRKSRATSELPPLRHSQMYKIEYDSAHKTNKEMIAQ